MFTDYFIKKKIQVLATQAIGRPHHSVSLDKANSVLVLYDAEDHESVMAALEPLRKLKKTIRTCVFVSADGAGISFDDSNIAVSKKELNAWKFPSEILMNKVVALQSDLLIDISRPASYPMQMLALQHPCLFKVGVKYQGQEWYDFALSATERDDIPYLLEQILFYLRSMR